jgi:NTE family protein/lysophospholipid hydrolase
VILAVGWAASSPALNVVEAILGEQPPTARLELALLHPDGTQQPRDTRAWLELRQPHAHYHLRLDRAADFARLARRLTGRAVGLVLGGGGARGFAHIGVYQALQEGGWEIDLLGGTSMGAILGAAFALDLTPAALYDLARQVASPVRLFDLTLPVVSFFSSEKVTAILRRVFGEIQIEDLWRPFFCVSSSLSHATPVVHRRGTLWQAVRASMAIPGVFSPLVIDGDLLVDGAVLNNLPSDVMLETSQGGPVIAVNVFPEVDLDKHYAFGPSVSGVEALWRKLNPLAEDLSAPSIFENLVRVVSLNDVQQARAKAAQVDLYLRPAVEAWNILDFGAWEAISAVGYATAQTALRGELTPRLAAARTTTPAPLSGLADTLETLAQLLEARQPSAA